MHNKVSLSVFIPLFNEEDNIEKAIESVVKAVDGSVSKFEIIAVNDASTDNSLNVLKQIAQKKKNLTIHTNDNNYGIGYSFRKALKLAKYDYITVFPGDNDMSYQSLKDLISEIGSADLVFSYPRNTKLRSLLRQYISKTVINIFNLITKLNIRYYNGPFIAKTNLCNKVKLKNNGFFVFAELKVRLLRMKYTFKEIPFDHIGRIKGESKAVSLNTFIETLKAIGILFEK